MLKFPDISVSLILLLFMLPVKAQQYDNYKYIDSLTYNLYLEENWKELSRTARIAFKYDIDYYYLRMRAGIAAFKRNNFLKAEKHFNKSIYFNHLDAASKEYLCYSYLYSGKKDDAKRLYNLSKSVFKLPEIPDLELKPVSEVMAASALFSNMNKTPENDVNFSGITGTDGYQTVTKDFFLTSAMLKHDVASSFFLSHGLTVISKNQYYLNSYTGEIYESLKNRSTQYQYYLSAKIIPIKKFSILGSFHYINYRIPAFYIYDKFNSTRYVMRGLNKNYFAGDISLFKSFSFFKTGLGLTFANLNDADQFQKNFTFVYFPFGNLNLYLTSFINHIQETKDGIPKETNLLYRQSVGIKIFNHLWVEATGYAGTLKNAALNEGSLIYNNNEPVTGRFDVSLIFPLNKVTLNVYLSYYSFSSTFIPDNGVNFDSNTMDFNGFLSLFSIKLNI